jgi:hypothetical protein
LDLDVAFLLLPADSNGGATPFSALSDESPSERHVPCQGPPVTPSQDTAAALPPAGSSGGATPFQHSVTSHLPQHTPSLLPYGTHTTAAAAAAAAVAVATAAAAAGWQSTK